MTQVTLDSNVCLSGLCSATNQSAFSKWPSTGRSVPPALGRMSRSTHTRAAATLHLALARAQSRAASAEALLAVPDMYRVELENEFVRVVRVRYPARSSGAIHTHPAPGALIVPDVGLERLVVRHTLSSLT